MRCAGLVSSQVRGPVRGPPRDTARYTADTAPITVPTTMLWPGADPLFPTDWADRLTDHFTDVRLDVIHGCGHFVPVERPGAVVRTIRSHLD